MCISVLAILHYKSKYFRMLLTILLALSDDMAFSSDFIQHLVKMHISVKNLSFSEVYLNWLLKQTEGLLKVKMDARNDLLHGVIDIQVQFHELSRYVLSLDALVGDVKAASSFDSIEQKLRALIKAFVDFCVPTASKDQSPRNTPESDNNESMTVASVKKIEEKLNKSTSLPPPPGFASLASNPGDGVQSLPTKMPLLSASASPTAVPLPTTTMIVEDKLTRSMANPESRGNSAPPLIPTAKSVQSKISPQPTVYNPLGLEPRVATRIAPTVHNQNNEIIESCFQCLNCGEYLDETSYNCRWERAS